MIKTEGTVQLSINELDNLRTQIQSLTDERNDLLSHAMEVKVHTTVVEKSFGYKEEYNWGSPGSRDYRGYPAKKLVADTKYNTIKEDVSYVGLQDVIFNIQQEETDKVIENIGSLERQVQDLKKQIQDLKTANNKTILEITESHQQRVTEIEDYNRKELSVKQAEIDTLNGVAVDQTKDQQIYLLQQEIERLKLKKGFWGFLS